jgi:magnesium-transporting ATPase (P-type)
MNSSGELRILNYRQRGVLSSLCRLSSWYSELKIAQSALQDRDHKVAAVGELIEHDFTLIGCTAIEDRLQEGVPECIATLAKVFGPAVKFLGAPLFHAGLFSSCP